jgi:hypothetical protein
LAFTKSLPILLTRTQTLLAVFQERRRSSSSSHVEAAEDGQDVLAEPALVVADGVDAALLAIGEPPFAPPRDRLP